MSKLMYGVDVAKCGFSRIVSNENKCFCWNPNTEHHDCGQNPDCEYKQLQKAKAKINDLEEQINYLKETLKHTTKTLGENHGC